MSQVANSVNSGNTSYCIYYLYYPNRPKTGYIGLTENLRKRLHAHLNNAPYMRSPWKDKWILKHGRDIRYRILEEGLTFKEATQVEVALIARYKQEGYRLKNATKGGEGMQRKATPEQVQRNREGHTQNAYVVLDKGTVHIVPFIRPWAWERGLNPSHLYEVANGKVRHHKGLLCFTRAEWLAFSSTERLEKLTESKSNLYQYRSSGHKHYWAFDGVQWHEVRGMRPFCKKHGLPQTSVMKHLGRWYKGWFVVKQDLRQSRAKLVNLLRERVETIPTGSRPEANAGRSAEHLERGGDIVRPLQQCKAVGNHGLGPASLAEHSVALYDKQQRNVAKNASADDVLKLMRKLAKLGKADEAKSVAQELLAAAGVAKLNEADADTVNAVYAAIESLETA